jgi:midasin
LDFVEELTIFWKFLFSYFENTSSGSAYHLGLDVLLSRLSQLSLDEKQDELIGDIVQEHSLLLRDMLQTGGNRTGIYLEPMWDHFKPPLLQQASLLPSILQLRDLADRFDHQSSKGMVNVSLVVKLRKSFRQSLQLMQDAQSQLTQDGHSPNPQGLIDELNDQLENIEKSTSMAQSPRRVFSAELNEISQGSYMLRVAGRPIPESTADLLDVVSAGSMPTRYFLSPAQFDSATGAARLLHDLSLYASCGAEEDETGDTQPPSTIQSLKLSKTVAFTDLEFFVEELTLFGEVLARCATFYLQEKEPIFDEALATLSTEMRRSLKSEIPGSSEHLKVAKTLLDETNDYLTNGANTAAQAWTALGVAAVLLYVPDHIIDPVEKQRLQLEAQGFIANQYKTRVAVLEEFELHAMFSRNPFRKQILAGQLAKEQQKSKPLTLLPERPTADILPELQAEFNRVIRVVGTICSRMMLNENIDDQTLAPSLLRIIRRLRKKYASHEDLAHPLIGFLSIILVGCMIRRNKRIETDATRGSWLSALFAPSFSDEKLQHYFPGSPINQLEVQVLNRALRMGLQDRSKSGTEDIFEMLYLKWKDEISKAQIENAKNASLYTFQDEQEIEDDIDEQLKLLFPGLELAEVESKAKPDELRDLSIRLSTIHRDLNSSLELNEVFMATMESTTAFDCNWNSTQILPLLYTKIHDRLLQLQASSVDASYNIYHDSNLQEAKKMADLASGSAKRFHSLHLRWPEHDSINEVLRICAEILGQGHAEPLMKYLPRCESLHFALDQWQKVASKEFRVDDLVERLTSLIADWRRLELSTWSRLLDFEISKCSDNAKSWWFILYENFMHVPDGQFNGAAQEHARVLGTLRTVEQFLSTSNIGEFVSRLDLLRVFALDVESRLEDHPWFRALAPGLSNIFSYFARFLGSVEKSLAQTRQKLEKEVKNVLLLASWKDTNIDSLKQSAKASHRKLFKVVRTFRQALHQPVALSLDQFPEKAIVGYKAQTDLTSSHEESSSLRSSDIIESWTWLPARFRNVNSTVEMIQLIYSRSNQYVRSSPRLESFLESLLQSISDLQRQTPKLLKEDNKDLVKHLKSQKRVLFATTLKGLREMGLSTNPTTTTLRQQDDICSVMAQIPAVSPDICNERWRTSEYFFHKVLTMLPTVRLLSREHSGDLSSSEVARCLGFFESLLNQTIQQRTRLATVLNEFVSLKRIFELVHILSSTNAIHHDRTATCSGLRENYLTSRRLSVSCLGIRNAISAQAELGKLDTKSVSQGLDAWSRTFSDYAANILALGNYPTNIASSAQIDVYQRGQSLYAEFESALATWSRQSPEASPVLDHLTDLLQKCNPGLNAESTLNSANPLAVDDFGQMVFSFLDLLLGAIQDLEAANSKLPDSQETPRWLVAESKAQIAAASTLRLPFLEERLKSAVDDLQHLQDEQLGIAVAALATFRPILTQFQDVGRQVIDELASLHASTVKVLYHLSASFLSVGKDGFCTPPEEQASGSDGEKLEGGDVFGDGEGAENVSGEMNEDDIASDTEAEPKQKDASGDESDNDALDADDSDMEGKAEDVSDTEDKSGDESEPELDEDVGDVNEGPSKIDEKRWDDGASSEKKEMETAETNNAQESEDQVATEGQDKANGKQDDANSPDHASPEDEDEEVTQNELDDGDQMQDSNNLDLPDDINLDSLSQPDMDSDVDDISDDDDASDMDIDDANENKPTDDQDDVSMTDEVDENAMDMDEASEPAEEGDNPVPQPDDAPNSGTNAGADADPNAPTDGDSSDKRLPQNNSAEDSAHREENAPDAGVMDADEEIGTNEEREDNQGDRSDGVGRTETTQHPTVESIKKLGDIMENWVRQSRPIQASQTEAATASIEDVADPDKVDFEHMQDDSKEDAQAMDVASKEEATALDQHMDSLASETHEREEYKAKDAESQELKNPLRPFNSAQDQTENNNSFIGSNAQSDRLEELGIVQAPESPEEHHVAEDLSNIHLDAQNQLAEEADFAEASTQWARHEQATRALASVLAEQLRLVLAPTHAAKLRGDFKTGKRINMRRIIPYIASSYKRDKIWMRRSVPSKRRYQIMIALDDSRSMRDDAASPTEAPTGAKVDLALQTLALVAKALSILEAGSTCFLGFGERVTVAHPFGAPFGPAAGPRLLSTFRFAQDGTDVPRLLRTATRMLADARRTGEGAGGAGEDVWQLLIVVGDGICEDHEAVRRMVRRAREERVMCVFVVVDCKGGSGGAGGGGGAPGIMELQTARFAADEASGEMRLVRARYMDTFPFEWWVVVRDVRELPGVLASALKQWFREIAHVPV